MSRKHHIIPIFVPHVGCPHDCVFCNQKKITGVSTDITSKDVDNTIKSYLETIPKSNEKLEVAFYGGSFTGIDRDIQEQLLKEAYKYIKNKYSKEVANNIFKNNQSLIIENKDIIIPIASKYEEKRGFFSKLFKK